MIVNVTLFKEISEQLNIPKEPYETDSQWCGRLICSLISGHMLAALYDFDDDFQAYDSNTDNTVSMHHVLKRGEELKTVIDIEFDCDYIRQLLIQNGYMLHKSNRLTYPPKMIANDNNITFVRGISPWERLFFSGAGMYRPVREPSNVSVEKMFGISEQDIDKWFDNFKKHLKWKNVTELPQNLEFLNTDDSAVKGYWQSKVPKSGTTLCRTKDGGDREYSIIRLTNGIEKSNLPDWQTENGEYHRIAIALRRANNNAPTLTATLKTYTAEVDITYLLPTVEQNFFELYSWAKEENNRWRRIVSIEIYPTLKRILGRLGYKIYEV
jgi:hypothetical protein